MHLVSKAGSVIGGKSHHLLHPPECKDVYLRFDLNKKSILALRRMLKSVRCLCLAGNIQNGATQTRRDREETNCWKKNLYFYFLCIQKVFSSLYIIQIEPLMADGVSSWCFSYFSVPRQCYLLDSHKPPGIYLKYLNCVPKTNKGFMELERHAGKWIMTIFILWWSNPLTRSTAPPSAFSNNCLGFMFLLFD